MTRFSDLSSVADVSNASKIIIFVSCKKLLDNFSERYSAPTGKFAF